MLLKLVTLLILLLSAPAWGTTYNIGPGQTYETFAAFFAAVTPAAGDIVDGGNNTFNEQVTIVTGSGTSGNPVIYRDFTADAQSTRDHGVYVTEVGVTLQNVTGKNALQNGISFVDSSYITVTNCSGINNAHFGLWVRTYEASHTTIYVSGGTYTGNAEHGILLMGYPVANRISTVAISGVTASNNAGAGIYLIGCNTVTVSNNIVDSNGTASDAIEDYGIAISGCNDATVSGNIITNTVNNDGFQMYSDATTNYGSTNNLIVHGNYINGSDGDCIGVGTFGNETSTGMILRQNILVNCAIGINLYHADAGAAASVSVFNNTITGCSEYGIRGESANFPAVLKNNIIASNAAPEVNFSASSSGLTTSNNLWYRASGNVLAYNGSTYTTANISTFEDTAVASDPLLNATYGLAGNSPAKDKGAVLYTYAAHPGDYYGRKIYGAGPDIGAVEYEDHTPGGWFFEFFIPTIMKLCASTNAACYTQP